MPLTTRLVDIKRRRRTVRNSGSYCKSKCRALTVTSLQCLTHDHHIHLLRNYGNILQLGHEHAYTELHCRIPQNDPIRVHRAATITTLLQHEALSKVYQNNMRLLQNVVKKPVCKAPGAQRNEHIQITMSFANTADKLCSSFEKAQYIIISNEY